MNLNEATRSAMEIRFQAPPELQILQMFCRQGRIFLLTRLRESHAPADSLAAIGEEDYRIGSFALAWLFFVLGFQSSKVRTRVFLRAQWLALTQWRPQLSRKFSVGARFSVPSNARVQTQAREAGLSAGTRC